MIAHVTKYELLNSCKQKRFTMLHLKDAIFPFNFLLSLKVILGFKQSVQFVWRFRETDPTWDQSSTLLVSRSSLVMLHKVLSQSQMHNNDGIQI